VTAALGGAQGQWSKWTNVWHSAAIRSTLYTMGAPGRGVKRLFERDAVA